MAKKNWIGGQAVSGSHQEPNRNPANPDDVIDHYDWATEVQGYDAVAAARQAQAGWAAFNPQSRSDILRRAGDEVAARAEELGRLLTREEGKTLREGIGEARRAAQILHYASGECVRAPGEFHNGLRDGTSAIVSRDPVGVVGLITPWNFPIALPAWKIAYALAYGNTVVLKPSEVAPGCAWELVDILNRAGLPPGVLNMINGDGRVLGQPMIDGCDAISFTGSPEVGRSILERSARRMIKLQLELGGKNPMIINSDADLDLAVEVVVQGAFFSTGQRCTATSRVIVLRPIMDQFIDKLVARVRSLKVGDPLLDATDIGPVVSKAQFDKVTRYIDIARKEGATLACGGGTPAGNGYFIEPTLFINTRNDMRINRDEVFGPVACVIPADDLDQAIAIANDAEHALSSGICTRDLKAAETFRRRSRAGLVTVNTPTAGIDYHVPFGGRSPSGYGSREQGSAAIEFFTEGKTTYINHGVTG